MKWDLNWFPANSKYPQKYWKYLNNQRDFMDSIAREYHVTQPQDWRRVSLTIIRNKGGSVRIRLLWSETSSPYWRDTIILYSTFFEHFIRMTIGTKWVGRKSGNKEKTEINNEFSSPVSEPQQNVWKYLKIFFPNSEIKLNYRHPSK